MTIDELREAIRLKRMHRDAVEAQLRGLEKKLPTVTYELAMLEEQLEEAVALAESRLAPESED